MTSNRTGILRYDFASDYDGDKCLIAPAGNEDWQGWRVHEVLASATRVELAAQAGGFWGYVHRNAEASWFIPSFADHVEVCIPGEVALTIHPHVARVAPRRCPVCAYDGPEAWPDPRIPSLVQWLRHRWSTRQGHEISRRFLGGERVGWPDSTDARCDLRGIDLSRQQLTGRDLQLARLDWGKLDGAILEGADFSVSSLQNASFVGANLAHAKLLGADAHRADFSGATLREVDARGSNLTLSRFWKAVLRSSAFDHACLMGADLRVADLRDCSLHWCDLEGALLTCANVGAQPIVGPWERIATDVGAPSFAQVLPGYVDALKLTQLSMPWHVEAALARSDDAELEVTNLIRQDNWQIAIVGVLAVAMGAPCETGLLWDRIRARSFIAPQVAVALKLRDPEFEQRARSDDRARKLVEPLSIVAATPEIVEGQRIAARWLQRLKLWTLARERNAHPALTLGERGEPPTTTRRLG